MRSPRDPRFVGVAGAASSEQERASIKQAVFLIRYRARILAAVAADPE